MFDPEDYPHDLECDREECGHTLFEHTGGRHGLACDECSCPIFLIPASHR